MPKNKTHSGTKKRFKVTGSGKIMRQQAMDVHKMDSKTSSHRRRLELDQPVAPADVKRIKRLLGK